MYTEEIYHCDYCDEVFSTTDKCREHEKTHMLKYDTFTNQELVTHLMKMLKRTRIDYHNEFGYRTVYGVDMFAENFCNLINTVSNRLKKYKR